MSTTTISKKRKSAGDATTAVKKVKTAKSAETPAPLKSALKKPKDEVAKKKEGKPMKAPAKPPKSAEKPEKVAKVTKAKKVKEPTEEATTGAEDVPDGGIELTDDQTAALIAGFSSSEDEADDDEEAGGIAIKGLPHAPRAKEIQKQIRKATGGDPEKTPGVIYIGRLPHGFFEPQMRAYLSQFGDITNLRLARSKKTGKSQHSAFIEFASKAVAEIVAKTMDKYLLFGHILQCKTIPMEQVKENMWKGAGKRKKPAPRNRLEGAKLKRGMVREDWEKKVTKEEKKRIEKAEKLKELGYEFEMPDVKTAKDVPIKATAIEKVAAAEGDEQTVKAIEEPRVDESVSAPAVEAQGEAEDVAPVAEKANKKRPAKEVKAKKAKKVET